MSDNVAKLIVVKIGGSTLGQHDTTIEDIVELQRRGIGVVVVHGGGKMITEWLSRQGTPAQFIGGERVTDKAGLEVVTAVLAGIVNKELVAAINCAGGQAVGISGVDGALLQGRIKNQEMGFTGVIVQVNKKPVEALLNSGFVPVISSVSLNTHCNIKSPPLTLNVNADLAAGEIAATVGAEKLVFLTDVSGVCDASGKVILRMSVAEAEALTASGVASGGMIPKIRAGIRALDVCNVTRIIDGRLSHALLNELDNANINIGTTIYLNKLPEAV